MCVPSVTCRRTAARREELSRELSLHTLSRKMCTEFEHSLPRVTTTLFGSGAQALHGSGRRLIAQTVHTGNDLNQYVAIELRYDMFSGGALPS